MLTSVFTAGAPTALLTVLFGALLWIRLDTIWSEERLGHWASLGALGAGVGGLSTLVHGFVPVDAWMQVAVAVSVVAAMGWWAAKRGWQHWTP